MTHTLQAAISAVHLAARNLTRNRKRAFAALATIVAGVVAMILVEGFVQWIFWAMREATIQSQSGHIQVVKPGYFQAGATAPQDYLLPARSAEFTALERTPGVKLVAPRVAVTGLASHNDTTVSFIGEGVDPAREAVLSKALRISQGRNLSNAQAREVILGRGLAQSLGVKPGDTIALLTTSASGGINAVETRVVGLFVSANQAYDASALRLSIGLARELLRVEGAHTWLVLLDQTDDTDRFLDAFRTRFASPAHPLEFVPWYTHADFYNKTVALFSQQMQVLRLIIGFIIVLSISNMLIMNVLERTGEIGTLLAVGFKRSKVLRYFALEAALLGLLGGTVGLMLGYALALLISAIGIPMPPPPGMDEGYVAKIMATPGVLMIALAIAVITTTLAGLYPAWKASRLDIVNALRHNI